VLWPNAKGRSDRVSSTAAEKERLRLFRGLKIGKKFAGFASHHTASCKVVRFQVPSSKFPPHSIERFARQHRHLHPTQGSMGGGYPQRPLPVRATFKFKGVKRGIIVYCPGDKSIG